MAGYSNPLFRALCRQGGAELCVTEMISVRSALLGSRQALEIMRPAPEEGPVIWQIAGGDPGEMADIAAHIESLGQAAGIDVNMGCPVPKVTRRVSGAGLLRDLDRATRILEAIVAAVRLPVSCKMRTGWDDESIVAPDLACAAAAAGCAWVTVHGRTREQLYSGEADLETIGRVKAVCPVPVVGNGDVTSPESARRMFEVTGCDGIAIGRGALGAPWIFGRIRTWLDTGRIEPEPDWPERIRRALVHWKLSLESHDATDRVFSVLKGHLIKYLGGHPDFEAQRRLVGQARSNEEMEAAFQALAAPVQDSRRALLPEVAATPSAQYEPLVECAQSQCGGGEGKNFG
ncbi:MAG: tRNA-dihydrouridine synthase [Candidatus Wallbacteria bacterium]|nr:tRNA-dihydrouridine synthase [Candidatus Wallbacteria bacterium]